MSHARILLFCATAWCLAWSLRPAVGAEASLNGHRFTVPPGFQVELVAAPPLVLRPITAALDEEGRLYVADSSGSNEPVQQQLKTKPHRILRLEDNDGNGHYETRRVFADRMMFPEGTLWKDGSLYVSAPPSIWRLTDTDDDGRADQREEWFQGKTLTGCANDLHGPYAAPDGWIYWCKGAFAEQTYPRPGQEPFVTRAAHIFRARPDGTGIEPVMTGGMDNPVDVVFTPTGERIFTTTFFQHPARGQRDGLVHAIYGGVYGKRHGVIEGHPRTGELMPVLTHLGPAAPAGLALYDAEVFGAGHQGNLFAALFNLHKVTRHRLIPQGPTFTTRDEDFLVSDQIDFHPTDVLVDADGSLIVVDTGGWYKICCPTSQLYKPDVLGAIYRVVRTGAHAPSDPRGRRLSWKRVSTETLATRLGDPRPVVRQRALGRLRQLGSDSVAALRSQLEDATDISARRHVVWALCQLDGPAARAALRSALGDPAGSVRHAAAHAVGLWRDANARTTLQQMLADESFAVQRAAAEALGRLRLKTAVPALLEAVGRLNESPLTGPARRVMEHSLVYALIEIGDPQTVRSGLAHEMPAVQAAALLALDQMKGTHLQPDEVTPHLVSAHRELQEAAHWIVGQHPSWAPALTGFFQGQLHAPELPQDREAELVEQLARFAQAPSIQHLLGETAGNPSEPSAARRMALRAMARAHPEALPEAWRDALQSVFGSLDFQLLSEATRAARALPRAKNPGPEFVFALRKVAGDPTIPNQTRLDALMAAPQGVDQVPSDLFDFLLGNLASDRPVRTRLDAATILAQAPLDSSQLEALADSVAQVGPMELTILLPAFARATEESLGLRLVAALDRSPFRDALRPDQIRPHLEGFPPSVQKASQSLFASMQEDLEGMQKRLETLLKSLPEGNVRRGQAVFNSTQAACAACHAIGYLGGHAGPDLTRIGQIRTERDLLEAILYPSASFVRSFEPIIVTTTDDNLYTGIIGDDAIDAIELVTGPEARVRIPRDQISEIQPGNLSLMPAGLDEVLSDQELADLLAFLKATRW